MARWLIYLKERFPIVVYTLLSGGLALSGASLVRDRIIWSAVIEAFIGLMLFFAELRLMDELKDYDKDRIAHPERPLPRGLLSREEVSSAIVLLWSMMFGYGVAIAAAGNFPAGFSYFIVTVYLWQMYKEFHAGKTLARYPLAYAVLHQIILLPLCTFAVATSHPQLWTSILNLGFGLCVLGAFFAYEICRKLDPKANPCLATYLFVYGLKTTTLLVVLALTVAAIGSVILGCARFLIPVELILAASLGILFRNPGKFKIVEGLAGVSLLAHMWSVFIQSLTGW